MLQEQENTKRTVCSEKDKLTIARYGNTHGPARAIAVIAKFVKEFPKLTVRAWIAKYCKELSANNKNNEEIPITLDKRRVDHYLCPLNWI